MEMFSNDRMHDPRLEIVKHDGTAAAWLE